MKVLVMKNSTAWGSDKQYYSDEIEIIEWLANHGYKAYRTGKTMSGKRIVSFSKPNCKTEYAIVC